MTRSKRGESLVILSRCTDDRRLSSETTAIKGSDLPCSSCVNHLSSLGLSRSSNFLSNRFCISSCHLRFKEAGQTTSAVSTRVLNSNSLQISPASIVFPRPTSSAIRSLWLDPINILRTGLN